MNEGEHESTFLFSENVEGEEDEQIRLRRYFGEQFDFEPGENPEVEQEFESTRTAQLRRKVYCEFEKTKPIREFSHQGIVAEIFFHLLPN